ncbi:hypothetical protein, partial [Streptomyces thermoalcalitolerans]|uniref:hypothetical protein n=1 Tax=Streptomyces thermoalcalitolerans TaxID=65605 RepID=UPI0031DBD3AF
GLGTLVGVDGWEAAKQAWKGLAQLATGLVLTASPLGAAFWTLPEDKLPSWIRDSRRAMKETGKALVAWDEWGKNPARAAGAVTFNVLTTVFTGGAGGAASGAGKAGAVARALSVAGKAGRAIDPMTYIAKGAGAGLSKIGDIAKGLKGIGAINIPKLPDTAITLPEGTIRLSDTTVRLPEGAALPAGAAKLPDGTVRLPDNTPVLPAGTVKLPTAEGAPARYFDPDGNILDEHGKVVDDVLDSPGDIVDQPRLDPPAGAEVPRVDSPVKDPALVGAGARTADQAGQYIRLGDSLDGGLGDTGRLGQDAPTTPTVHAGGDLPTVHAGDHLPGGRVESPSGITDNTPGGMADNLPTNSADNTPPRTGTGDNLPGGSGNHVPSNSLDNTVSNTSDTASRSGGQADDLSRGSTGGHDLPGGSTADTLPRADGPTGSELDELGAVGDDALGDAGRRSDEMPTSGHQAGPERPSFMRDGDNPYGPEGSLTPEQIKEIQVYRANHEPGYFEQYYYADGRRLNTKTPDESGLVPVQLHVDPVTGVKTAASDAPPPIPEKYVAGAEVKRGRGEVLDSNTLKTLDEAATLRRSLIDYSMSAERHRDLLAAAVDSSPDGHLALLDASNEYKAAMKERTEAAEDFGEAVAEHQVIPELYPDATVKEKLYGPANGNDQFDQVWRRKDGGFVVVEAKSSVNTPLGKREVLTPDGKRSAMQGTREYFMDIIRQMEKRGRKYPSEARLAQELEQALTEGKVEYILVKGKVDGGQYAGYEKYQFDIG